MSTLVLILFGGFCGVSFALRKVSRLEARRGATAGDVTPKYASVLRTAVIALYGVVGASLGGVIDLVIKLS